MRRIISLLPVIILSALTVMLAACGSSSATTGGTTTPTTTAACLNVTTGTIRRVSNLSLQVTSLQGKIVPVTLTSATTITRQATLTGADLKTGLLVSIIVKQNVDSTYSALTVSQINGNSLTVTDTSSNDFTVTYSATTPMTEQRSVTASDLKTGEAVTIIGSANSQGVITASSVSLLQTLPTKRATPIPTPSNIAITFPGRRANGQPG